MIRLYKKLCEYGVNLEIQPFANNNGVWFIFKKDGVTRNYEVNFDWFTIDIEQYLLDRLEEFIGCRYF